MIAGAPPWDAPAKELRDWIDANDWVIRDGFSDSEHCRLYRTELALWERSDEQAVRDSHSVQKVSERAAREEMRRVDAVRAGDLEAIEKRRAADGQEADALDRIRPAIVDAHDWAAALMSMSADEKAMLWDALDGEPEKIADHLSGGLASPGIQKALGFALRHKLLGSPGSSLDPRHDPEWLHRRLLELKAALACLFPEKAANDFTKMALKLVVDETGLLKEQVKNRIARKSNFKGYHDDPRRMLTDLLRTGT